MLIERKVAVNLRNVEAKITANKKTEEKPIFTKDDVAKKFGKILSDKSFSNNMNTLRANCVATGGRKLAAEWVERAFVGTVEHLVDNDYVLKAKKMNFCCSIFFIIFLVAQFIAFLFLVFDIYLIIN